MPGYEIERFEDLTQNDKDELSCTICQDILYKPIVAQCCEQSFCEDCINDWLKNNNTCPYDRKTLTSSGLTRPPRIMLNMLGKLKIHCDFKENGCKEVVLLENLSQHTVKCRYNVHFCNRCLCKVLDKRSHDCIKTLLELNRKANEEIETLKHNSTPNVVIPSAPSSELRIFFAQNSLEEPSLLSEIRELRAEKENFLKTIQDLNAINSSLKVSEPEIFNHAKISLWNPVVVYSVMDADITNKVLLIVRNEIKEYNPDFIVCKNIVLKLNTEFGTTWNCIVSHHKSFNSYYANESDYLIKLKFGELYLEIYKTQLFNFRQFQNRFRSGKTKIEISRTDMKEDVISQVKKITFGAIEKSNKLSDISSELKTQMEKRYPGNWQCFVNQNLATSSLQLIRDIHAHIWFSVDCLTVILYKISA